MAETKITTGDEAIVSGDDAIVTTDEAVRTSDDAVASVGGTRAQAERALLDALGPLLDDDYLPGKTRFRDVLCGELGLSQLQAEELVDDLERAGRLRFVRTEDSRGWEIEHMHIGKER